MKVILILALATVASATFLRQANPTKNYENPWVADEVNGACHADETKHQYTDSNNQKWAMCMPMRNHGTSESCPQPPLFDASLLDAYAVNLDEYNRGCVVECSHS